MLLRAVPCRAMPCHAIYFCMRKLARSNRLEKRGKYIFLEISHPYVFGLTHIRQIINVFFTVKRHHFLTQRRLLLAHFVVVILVVLIQYKFVHFFVNAFNTFINITMITAYVLFHISRKKNI